MSILFSPFLIFHQKQIQSSVALRGTFLATDFALVFNPLVDVEHVLLQRQLAHERGFTALDLAKQDCH